MTTQGLLVRLIAPSGKDEEVESFLQSALPLVEQEPATAAWFAIKFGRGDYGIVDFFPDEGGREAHLSGGVAQALREKSRFLFDESPRIQKLTVLADKLPPAGPDRHSRKACSSPSSLTTATSRKSSSSCVMRRALSWRRRRRPRGLRFILMTATSASSMSFQITRDASRT